MLGVIVLFPAIESLGRNVEVTATKTSIFAMGVVVIEPFEPLPSLLDSLGIFARPLYPGIVL